MHLIVILACKWDIKKVPIWIDELPKSFWTFSPHSLKVVAYNEGKILYWKEHESVQFRFFFTYYDLFSLLVRQFCKIKCFILPIAIIFFYLVNIVSLNLDVA